MTTIGRPAVTGQRRPTPLAERLGSDRRSASALPLSDASPGRDGRRAINQCSHRQMVTKRPSPCHDATPEPPNELMLPYQALTGAGSQGWPVRAAWMASMGRMPWLRLVTR